MFCIFCFVLFIEGPPRICLVSSDRMCFPSCLMQSYAKKKLAQIVFFYYDINIMNIANLG